MKTTKEEIKNDLKKLTKYELKIYKNTMSLFPNTTHKSAYNKAIELGKMKLDHTR